MSVEKEEYAISGGYSKVHAGFGAGNQKDVHRVIGHLRQVVHNVETKENGYWNYGGFRIHTLRYGTKTIIKNELKEFESLAEFDSFLESHDIPRVEMDEGF